MRFLTLIAMLMPAVAIADSAAKTVLDFVQDHCIRKEPAGVMYDLPGAWDRAGRRETADALPNLAIEEGIDYAAFVKYQVEISQTVEPERAWPLTVESYEKQLSDERAYTRRDWQRLFIHQPTGAHLYIAAGEDTDNPDDWHDPSCYLWHPDEDAPLAAAIIDRWDVPFGKRLETTMGQATHSWNKIVVNGEQHVFESRVIRPNTDYADGLAPVILKLEFTGY